MCRSKGKKKTYCKSEDKHKEQQKEKHENVKKKNWKKKKDLKVIESGERKEENLDAFFIMCLSLYDYQAKASRYRKGLTSLKNRATTNQNQTLHSQN